MAMLSNQLYPPIIDTYMPAFVASENGGKCTIRFSLSKYNSLESIKTVWITVNNQFTNESVVNTSTGLLYFNKEDIEVADISSDDKYSITISSDKIIDGWTLNQLYKVQIRFSNSPNAVENSQKWIIDNESYFSEWSTVCLIHPISEPTLELKGFIPAINGNETIFTSLDNVLIGNLKFKDKDDEEYLESYNFKIYNRNDLETVLFDSGTIFTNEFNPNEINCFINYAFVDGEQYTMHFSYKTSSLYERTIEYNFTIVSLGGEFLDANISAEPDEEEGRIKIHVYSDTNRFFGNLTIRRTSSNSNFQIWEDIHTTSVLSEDFLDFTWYDYTIESGVWYKYCVQKRSMDEGRGLIIPIEKPIMAVFQDMFLTRDKQQLKIKFNPKVSSFKHTLSDSLNQTLGSKYPFIKRNGSVNYRQFSISGLISHFMDENELFMSIEDRYCNQKDLYNDYNEKNRISEYNDFTLERVFRDKVKEFLYENNVKLFRSPAEGNILVRLMDVSFSPEETLGRMIYSFSATAYEIDDLSFNNFEKYGIQKVGTCSSEIINNYNVTGQYFGKIKGSLKEAIQTRETGKQTKGLVKEVTGFKNLDLVFESDPYLINVPSVGSPTIVSSSDSTNESTILGYLIKINNKDDIIIGAHGKYALTDEDTLIEDITFLKEENVSFNFTYNVKEYEAKEKIPQQVYYTSRVGQIWGWTNSVNSLYSLIYNKYSHSYAKSYQRLFSLNSIQIEADKNTVFYLKDESSDTFQRFMIGDGGYLNIEDRDFSIIDLYCLGTYLTEKEPIVDEENQIIYYIERTKDYEFMDLRSKKLYNSVDEILDPVKNGVYSVMGFEPDFVNTFSPASNQYLSMIDKFIKPKKNISLDVECYSVIYFQDNWYIFTENNEVLKPCQYLIDYNYELEEGEFYNV